MSMKNRHAPWPYAISFLVLLSLLTMASAATFAQGGYGFGNVSFGTVYGAAGPVVPATSIVHVEGTGNYYSSTGAVIITNGGIVSFAQTSLHPGINYVQATFTPNSTGGAIVGSTTMEYRSMNGYPNIDVTFSAYGNNIIPTATAGLKYQVLSLLYIAPGSASTSGFSSTLSEGATTSVSQDFSNTDSLTFSSGIFGNNNGVTFSTGQSYGDASSYSTYYQAMNGSQLDSVQQKIDHTQDVVYLLVDPSITVTQTGDTSGTYVIGPSLDAKGNFPNGVVPADILHSNIRGLENPANGNIPLSYLEPQVPNSGTSLPGLDSICANPLPPSQCTTQNACGCTAADFAPIVSQDELANDTNDSTSPSSIDPNRYVYVTSEALQGPEQQGSAPVKNTYAITDGSMSSETLSNGTSYSVGYSHTFILGGFGPFSLKITATDTFTYSQTQTAGVSNGKAHTASVTLGTSDVGCNEYVDVFEDTTYHTFAYALSQPAPPSCQ